MYICNLICYRTYDIEKEAERLERIGLYEVRE